MRGTGHRRLGRWGLVVVGTILLALWWSRVWWAPQVARVDVRRHAGAVPPVAPLARRLGDAAVPGLITAWLQPSGPGERLVAAHTLQRIGTPRARDATVAVLFAGKSTVKKDDLTLTVAALSSYRDPIADGVLYEIAADLTWPRATRVYAVAALIDHDPPRLRERLVALARPESDAAVGRKVIDKLGLRGDKSLDEVLLRYLEHDDPTVRLRAARAIRQRRDIQAGGTGTDATGR